MDIPYTQQFSVKQTPLKALLPILRQHAGNRGKLKTAIASAFFKDKKTPEKIAGNTVIALKAHGIIEANADLTAFGKTLINLSPDDAAIEVARNILKNLGGFQVVETLREMKLGGHELSLIAVTAELKSRGLSVSENSSDLSGVRGWLEAAGILKEWEVIEDRYAKVIGAEAKTIDALKDLSSAQLAFLRAMVALNIQDFTTYTSVITHAESLFAGQVTFNKKLLEKEIVQPLEAAGFIEVRRPPKSVPGARGGKPADIRPTPKFDADVATPLLESLFKNAGQKDLRKIRSVPLARLVADVRQNRDINLKGQALEMLAIRFCQLLGLEFVGWRQTDEKVSAGGEVDAIMQSARLIYSRWQIQCKATDKIAYETLAKEYGVAAVSLASVILVVSTGAMTPGAAKYRAHIVQKTALNMIVIDGTALDAIVADPAVIGSILETQARDAMRLKEQLLPLQSVVLPGA
jgi:site-specific DNA-methyltransferase (cytosine-N4-specific)